MSLIKRFIREEDGATAIEYGLIAALVSVAIIGVLGSFIVPWVVPLILAGLAVAIGFQAGLFNIGAEGQLLIGGITAAWVGTWSVGMSMVLVKSFL